LGERFLQQGKYASAWRCLRSAISRDKNIPRHDIIWLHAGLVNRRLGNCTEALRHLRRFQTDDKILEAESLSLQAMCLRRLGREREFERMIRRLRRLDPAHEEYLRLLRAAAYDAEVKGDAARITEYYEEIRTRFPDSTGAVEAHWKLAWESYRSGNFDSAVTLFRETIRQDQGLEYAMASLFWYGVTRARMGDHEEGRGALLAVIDMFPYGYYSSLARNWLNSLPPDYNEENVRLVVEKWLENLRSRLPAARNAPIEDWSLAVEATDISPVVEAYVIGHYEHCYRSLVALEPHIDSALKAGYFESRAAIADLAENVSGAIANFTQAHPEWSQVPLGQYDRSRWEMIFPRKYLDIIRGQVDGHGIDPFLILALIRQESAFQVDARSASNALGLMQLLTGTAAAEMKFRGSRRQMMYKLLDPAYNIRAGCRHLQGLLRTFDGRIPLALAAYNGGTRRVRNTFRENRERLSMAEIIELIPMSQSRNYVKYVLRNLNYYSLLYRGEAADFSELFAD
jgi:soluble lytic murein transglycosylase